MAVQFVEVRTLEPVCPQSQKVCPEKYALEASENWVGYSGRSSLRWGEAACCELQANTQSKQEDDGQICCHQHGVINCTHLRLNLRSWDVVKSSLSIS